MNTKKIWLVSLGFGIVMAIVTYFALFTNDKASTSEKNKAEISDEGNTKVAKAAENNPTKRKLNNPIVKISEGKRAISLRTILEGGVSGYIEPNSMVDVIAYEMYIDEKTKKKYKSSVIILQNIKVLASGKSSDSEEEALHYETVTLEVTPDQGLTLSLAAKDKDGFYFMLRNAKDKSVIENMKRSTREVIDEGKGD